MTEIKDIEVDMNIFDKWYRHEADELKNKSQARFASIFLRMFIKCPELVSIRWQQGTPSFNDGDECKFTSHLYYATCEFESIGEVNEMSLDELEFCDFYKESDDKNPYDFLIKSLEFLSNNTYEDIFKYTFGDGADVLVTRDGITVKEYDFEY